MTTFIVLLTCGNKQQLKGIHCKNKTVKLYHNNKIKFLQEEKTQEILPWKIFALDYPSRFYNGLVHTHVPSGKTVQLAQEPSHDQRPGTRGLAKIAACQIPLLCRSSGSHLVPPATSHQDCTSGLRKMRTHLSFLVIWDRAFNSVTSSSAWTLCLESSFLYI